MYINIRHFDTKIYYVGAFTPHTTHHSTTLDEFDTVLGPFPERHRDGFFVPGVRASDTQTLQAGPPDSAPNPCVGCERPPKPDLVTNLEPPMSSFDHETHLAGDSVSSGDSFHQVMNHEMN
jgi:hypothetical protein